MTFDVLKLLISNEINELQPSNIDSISVTLVVSNVDKFKVVKEVSPRNIFHIIWVLGVKKCERSIELKLIQL